MQNETDKSLFSLLSGSRRRFLGQSAAAIAGGLATGYGKANRGRAAESGDSDVIDIGSRRELFIDDAIIESLSGTAEQRLHHPTPQEIVLEHDNPWEGSGSGYHSVFRDGDIYRMYYKAWHLDVQQGSLNTGRHPLYCCYAESTDGIRWERPDLGLFEFAGSKQNNIVLASEKVGPLNVDAGHPAVFYDENPGAETRYKAIVRSSNPNGLLPFESSDGLHWSPMTDKAVLSGKGAFDSQNLAFWDPNIGKYRAYWRIFTEGRTDEKVWKPGGIRAIRTATSDDLINWGEFYDIEYVDSPPEELYTNQIKPYYRAPHMLIGLPTRYVDRGWSESMEALPELENRKLRSSSTERYGTAITDVLLMASRDGHTFRRWNEAFLRPGAQRPGTWNYGQQYVAWHVVETASALSGAAPELSLYSTEDYWTGESSSLRRYTLRLDGFVSVSADRKTGDLVTKPLKFAGNRLSVNFATSAVGGLRVELQRPDGSAIEGFTLDDSQVQFGDTVDRTLVWKNGNDVGSLAGQAVRLRFQLEDADLYSFQFVDA